jgi:hypothetical protein
MVASGGAWAQATPTAPVSASQTSSAAVKIETNRLLSIILSSFSMKDSEFPPADRRVGVEDVAETKQQSYKRSAEKA